MGKDGERGRVRTKKKRHKTKCKIVMERGRGRGGTKNRKSKKMGQRLNSPKETGAKGAKKEIVACKKRERREGRDGG